MKLNFDKNSLEISGRKVITSVISIMPAENIFFPEKNWNDSIVIILDSWIQSMMNIFKDGYSEAQFVFFDGPFSFKIMKKDNEYTVELFQGSRLMENYGIDFSEFGYNLVKLSREILKEVKARGWESNDLEQFEFSLKKASPYFESKNKHKR